MEKKKDRKAEEYIDKALNFLLTKNTAKYLTIIVLVGAFLRYLVVNNVSFLGDEMAHGTHAIGMWNSGLLSTVLESPAWFYLTDTAMKLFGVTIFGNRFLSFFYGTLAILLVYLLGKQIFNKKIGILAATLLAISGYHIRYTLMEMDHAFMFFVLFAMYTFIVHFKEKKPLYLYLTALLLGTGILIKTITAFFIPVFVVFYFLFKKEKKILDYVKPILGVVIILFFFSLPILAHNLILYQQKEVVDTYFAQYFNINREVHSGQLGYDQGFDHMQIFTGTWSIVRYAFWKMDAAIFIIGVLGMIFSWKAFKKKENAFLVTATLFGFFALIISNLLHTHYTNFMPLLALYAAVMIYMVSERKDWKKHQKKIFIGTVGAILLINMFILPDNLWPHLTSQTANAKMREYVIESIPEDSLVIADARIYRGRIAWLFNDRHYLESAYFGQLYQLNQQYQGPKIPVPVYFVECARDDCGWGTIQGGELNDSTEQLALEFEKNSELLVEFKGGGGYDEETNEPHFKVYRVLMDFAPNIFDAVDDTHMWFYYPVRYEPKEKSWDYYVPQGFVQSSLHKIGFTALYISILLAIAAVALLFYELKR